MFTNTNPPGTVTRTSSASTNSYTSGLRLQISTDVWYMKSALTQNGNLGRVSGPRTLRMSLEDDSPRKKPTKSVTFDNMDEIIQYIQPTPEVTQDEWETASLASCELDLESRPLPKLPKSLSEQTMTALHFTADPDTYLRNSRDNIFRADSGSVSTTNLDHQLTNQSSMKSAMRNLSNINGLEFSGTYKSSERSSLEPGFRLDAPISVSDEDFDFSEEETTGAATSGAPELDTSHTEIDQGSLDSVQLSPVVIQPPTETRINAIMATGSGMSPCMGSTEQSHPEKGDNFVRKKNKESNADLDEAVEWRSQHESLLVRQDSLQESQRRPPTETLSESLPEPSSDLERSFSRRRKDILQLLNPYGAGVQQTIGFKTIHEEDEEKLQPSFSPSPPEAVASRKHSPETNPQVECTRVVEMDSSLSEVSDIDQSIGISTMPAAQYANRSLPFDDMNSNAQADYSRDDVIQPENNSLSFGLPVLHNDSFEFGFSGDARDGDASYNMSRITYYDSNVPTLNSEHRLSEMIESSGSDDINVESEEKNLNRLVSKSKEGPETEDVSRRSPNSTTHCLEDLSFVPSPIHSPLSSPEESQLDILENSEVYNPSDLSFGSPSSRKSVTRTQESTNLRSQSAWTLAASDSHGFVIPKTFDSSENTLSVAKNSQRRSTKNLNLTADHHAFPGALPWNPSVQSLSDYTKFQRNTDAQLNTTLSSTIFPANFPRNQHRQSLLADFKSDLVPDTETMDSSMRTKDMEPQSSSSPNSKSHSLIHERQDSVSESSRAEAWNGHSSSPRIINAELSNSDSVIRATQTPEEQRPMTYSSPPVLHHDGMIVNESSNSCELDSATPRDTEVPLIADLTQHNVENLKTPEIPPQSPERIRILRDIKAARTPNQSSIDVRKATKPADSSILDYLQANVSHTKIFSGPQNEVLSKSYAVASCPEKEQATTELTPLKGEASSCSSKDCIEDANADLSSSEIEGSLRKKTFRDSYVTEQSNGPSDNLPSIHNSPKSTLNFTFSDVLLSPIGSPNMVSHAKVNEREVEWEPISDISSSSQSEAFEGSVMIDDTNSIIDEHHFSARPIINKYPVDTQTIKSECSGKNLSEDSHPHPAAKLDRNQASNQSLREHPPFSPTNVPKWSPIDIRALSFVSQEFEEEIKSTLESTSNNLDTTKRASLIVPRPLPEFRASRSYSLSASGNFEVHPIVFEGERAKTTNFLTEQTSKHASIADSSILRDLSLTNIGLSGYDLSHCTEILEADEELADSEQKTGSGSEILHPSPEALQMIPDSTKRVLLGPRPLPEVDINIRQPSFGENISSSILDLANCSGVQIESSEFSARGQYVIRESGSYVIATSPQRTKGNRSIAYDTYDWSKQDQGALYSQVPIPRNRETHIPVEECVRKPEFDSIVDPASPNSIESKKVSGKGSHGGDDLKVEQPVSIPEVTKAHENWTKLHDLTLSDTEQAQGSFAIPDKMVLPVRKKSKEPLSKANVDKLRQTAEVMVNPSASMESLPSLKAEPEFFYEIPEVDELKGPVHPIELLSNDIDETMLRNNFQSKATPGPTAALGKSSGSKLSLNGWENPVGMLYMKIKGLSLAESELPQGARVKMFIDNGVHSIASRTLKFSELPLVNEGYKVGIMSGCPASLQLKISLSQSSTEVMELGSDGSYAHFDLTSYSKTAFGRTCEVTISGRNIWTEKKPKVASIIAEFLYLPHVSPKEKLPQTITEATEKIAAARESVANKPPRATGLLRQFGGDIQSIRGKLRYCVLDPTSPLLIIHSARSRRPRALINLAKAIKVDRLDKQTLEISFRNKESLAFRTTNSSTISEWVLKLEKAINKKGARPKWLDAVLYET